MVRVLDVENEDVVLLNRLPEIAAQHLPKLRSVVKSQGSAVDSYKPTAVPHEVDERALLRVSERQISVGHHHDTVELGQVLRRYDREIQALGVLLVSLQCRHLESRALSPRGHGEFGGPEAGVLVQSGVGEEQQLAGLLLGSRSFAEEGSSGHCQDAADP